ncbi:MAG: glycosyltransferase family 4 protein [bacterium]|nr:glycosyltransferase family 4 protein [bacterium]
MVLLLMDNVARKIKVIFVITKSNFGGAQKYVFDLATGLPKEQFVVSVAVGGAGTLVEKLRAQNISVFPLFSITRDVNLLSDIKTFFELLKIFSIEKPRVVHVNSAKAGGVGALAARLAGVPKIIFTAHGWAFNEERPVWQRFVIKIFSWLTVLLSHKTIAVSDAVKNDIATWPFVPGKIVTIKNGISEPDFLTRKDAQMHLFAHANIQIPENAFVLGTIAELHKNKGISYAIEAFNKFAQKNPSLYYFIISDGEEMEKLVTLIKLRGLQDRVFLLGFVEDASRYLKAFDIFVLPSITEGLALVILEAGLAGLPVIATNVGGIPEIIEDGRTGLLVPAHDPDAIAETVQKLIENPALAKRLGEALRERVATHFSLNRVLKETLSFYIISRNDTIRKCKE